MKPRRFNFFHPNDGTVPYPNNDDENNNVLWERINDLETMVESLQNRNRTLDSRLQQYIGNVTPTDIQVIRDEQRINRDMSEHIENYQAYFHSIRQEQLMRIARNLLQENLIDHTLRVEEPNGDYISRMILRVQNNLT